MIPITQNRQGYRGADYGLTQKYFDKTSGTKQPYDLTTYSEIIWRGYDKDDNIAWEKKYSDGGLSVIGTDSNVLSGTLDQSTTKDLMQRFYSHEIVAKVGGKDFPIESGKHFWMSAGDDRLDIDVKDDIVIDNKTDEVTLEDSNVYVALALKAKQDTQALKDSLEWKGPWESGTTYAKDNRVSYQGEAFISLQDDNQGNTPVGDSNDSFWDILVEQSTTTNTVDETDTTQSVTGKAVGDYDQKIIDLYSYLSKELSNLDERITDLENA